MDVIKYYLCFYICSTVLANLYSKLKKEEELPFVIVLYVMFILMAEIKIKNLFLFLLYLISFPFINIFVAFMNGRKKPGFFEITYKEELSGYDFEVSKQTVEALTENLVTKKIRFKEKYLENRLKVLSILSFRRILHYQFVSKQERFKLDSVITATERSGRYAEAVKWSSEFDRIIPPSDPDWAPVRLRLADLYRRGGRTAEWQGLLQEIIKNQPKSIYARMARQALESNALDQRLQTYLPKPQPLQPQQP